MINADDSIMIIIGDWTDEKRTKAFYDAEEYLIDTQDKHYIYGTGKIINVKKVLDTMPFLNYRQQVTLVMNMISICDMAYMLKGFEYNNDSRMMHDYADTIGLRVVYSKKF